MSGKFAVITCSAQGGFLCFVRALVPLYHTERLSQNLACLTWKCQLTHDDARATSSHWAGNSLNSGMIVQLKTCLRELGGYSGEGHGR